MISNIFSTLVALYVGSHILGNHVKRNIFGYYEFEECNHFNQLKGGKQ